jgi:hypothetical protein
MDRCSLGFWWCLVRGPRILGWFRGPPSPSRWHVPCSLDLPFRDDPRGTKTPRTSPRFGGENTEPVFGVLVLRGSGLRALRAPWSRRLGEAGARDRSVVGAAAGERGGAAPERERHRRGASRGRSAVRGGRGGRLHDGVSGARLDAPGDRASLHTRSRRPLRHGAPEARGSDSARPRDVSGVRPGARRGAAQGRRAGTTTERAESHHCGDRDGGRQARGMRRVRDVRADRRRRVAARAHRRCAAGDTAAALALTFAAAVVTPLRAAAGDPRAARA